MTEDDELRDHVAQALFAHPRLALPFADWSLLTDEGKRVPRELADIALRAIEEQDRSPATFMATVRSLERKGIIQLSDEP